MSGTLLEPVGSMRPGDHWCLPFTSDSQQRDIAAAYVRDGLAQHDKVVYFSSGDPAPVRDFLAERDVPVAAGIETGQLRVLSAPEGYLSVSPFDPEVLVERLQRMVEDARAEGYRGLRATGEVHALRGRPGFEHLAEYERRVTGVYAGGSALGLCQYDVRAFDGEDITDALAAHSRHAGPDPLFEDTLLTIVPSYTPRGLRMMGEVDISHCMPGDDRVLAALRGLTEDLHVDMSGLRFLDVAGARLLAQIAEHLDSHGALLILRQTGRQVLSVLRLTGWHRLPNLVLDDSVPE